VRRRRLGADVDFWPAFTDVLSGMLLVMVFALTFFALTQAGLVQVVGGKDAALRALEDQLAELRRLLGQTEARADELQRELLAATALLEDLSAEGQAARAEATATRDELEAERARIADLVRQLREYVQAIEELNARLAQAEEVAESRRASIGELQLAVNRLREQLARMAAQLAVAEKQAQSQALRLSDLLAEMARKDARIAELERLEKYTSEFLARMSEVFKDNPNIKVVGDRFVFQSEVLFASGSAEVGEAGRRELQKFVDAFRGLIPRIPRELQVNVQVQGHTDTDAVVLSDRFKDNWDLSAARALAVVDYLGGHGVPQDMLSAAGFGEYQPRIPGQSPAAKAQNRRIEIRITRR
jgi:chemotaxis protein MotB